MSAVKFVISIALMIVFLYFTVTSVQRLMVASEEVDKAQKEYDIAVAENKAAQAEMNNVKPNCDVTERDSTGRPISWVCP